MDFRFPISDFRFGERTMVDRSRGANSRGWKTSDARLCTFAPLREFPSGDLEWEMAEEGVYSCSSETKRVVRNPQRCNHKVGIGPADIRWCNHKVGIGPSDIRRCDHKVGIGPPDIRRCDHKVGIGPADSRRCDHKVGIGPSSVRRHSDKAGRRSLGSTRRAPAILTAP